MSDTLFIRSLAAGCCIGMLLSGCVKEGSGTHLSKLKQPSRSERIQEAARIKTQLAVEYMNSHDYRSATQTIEEALKDNSSYDIAWLVRAQIYQFLHVQEKAEESFRQALTLSPNGAEINNNYGWYLCQFRNREAESIAYFDKALADPTYPTPEVAYLNKGICNAKMGQIKMADAYFERALQANPNFIPAHKERARILLQQNQPASADRAFRLYQSRVAKFSADDLLLGWKIARANDQFQAASEYQEQLRLYYPYSDELKSTISTGSAQ